MARVTRDDIRVTATCRQKYFDWICRPLYDAFVSRIPTMARLPLQSDMSRMAVLALFVSVALAGCGGRSYIHGDIEATGVIARAETQTSGGVTVRSAVPGADETAEIFGLPLYKQGIQPIWIEIRNDTEIRLRYAPVGTDRYYFSPLEVAWKNRGPYDDQSRIEMERKFDEVTMPRIIEAGETVSGFVFSNYRPGVKAFNVDLFGNSASYDFTFLLPVPGFTADYANIDFANVYQDPEFADFDEAGFRTAIIEFPCCTLGEDGQPGELPINVVLIGEGLDLLKSFLRGDWTESSSQESARVSPAILFGRKQDAIFTFDGSENNGYYEIRLWLAPMRVDGKNVWMGALRHVIDNAWSITRSDPDMDIARNFMLQNMWYAQSIRKFAWVRGQEVVPVESFWQGLFGAAYFTDGYRGVYWLSGEPVSYLEAERLDWDKLSDE